MNHPWASGDHPTGTESDHSSYGRQSERVVVWQRLSHAAEVDAERVEQWLAHALTRIEVNGGEILARLGTTWVFAFEAVDCEESVELSLALLHDANEHFAPLLPAFGIAVGPILRTGSPGQIAFDGAPLDRAQALSNGARNGDILVDETAFERLVDHCLFGREVTTHQCRGHAIDADTPRKRECRAAVLNLRRAPVSQARRAAFDSLQERVDGSQERSILFRSQYAFEPLDWLTRIAEVAAPPFQLHLRSQAAGLQPLGSLQAALTHGPSQTAIDLALSRLPDPSQSALESLRAGHAIPRADAVQALATLLSCTDEAPWVVLHRLHDIDAASLGVLAECRATMPKPPLLFASVPHNAAVPALLFPEGDQYELVLEDLTPDERQATAAAILELPVDSPIPRRIALLADSSPLGVIETCRTLVAAGDLVPTQQGFRWRAGPRQAQAAIPVEALIAERMSGMPALAYRMLEVLAVVPAALGQALCQAVAERDGAAASECKQGLLLLQEDGFADPRLDLGQAETIVRTAVKNAMPPARSAELNRFVALSLVEEGSAVQPHSGFGQALLAHHQAEGGLREEAAITLLDASADALRCGFQRMAVRLAATAVELDPSAHAQVRASELMLAMEDGSFGTGPGAPQRQAPAKSGPANSPPPPPKSVDSPPPLARQSLTQAIAAISARDLDTVEQCLETATAAGGSRRAAKRLHAMALLASDETERAAQVLQQGQTAKKSPANQARDTLALGLIRLQSGDAHGAIRDALICLSMARKNNEANGQRAALLVLSACYAASDDAAQAEGLRLASEQVRG